MSHERGAIRVFLSRFPEGTPVASDSVGNWYSLRLWRRHRWIVDEVEAAGCIPPLATSPRPRWATSTPVPGTFGKADELDDESLPFGIP